MTRGVGVSLSASHRSNVFLVCGPYLMSAWSGGSSRPPPRRPVPSRFPDDRPVARALPRRPAAGDLRVSEVLSLGDVSFRNAACSADESTPFLSLSMRLNSLLPFSRSDFCSSGLSVPSRSISKMSNCALDRPGDASPEELLPHLSARDPAMPFSCPARQTSGRHTTLHKT